MSKPFQSTSTSLCCENIRQRSQAEFRILYLDMSGKLRTPACLMRFSFSSCCPQIVIIHGMTSSRPPRHSLLLCPFLLVTRCLRHIKAKAIRVQVDFVCALLQDLRNVLRVLELPQIDICPALLDRVTNQFGRSCLTLCADDSSLLLLTRLVDDESGTLCLLLSDLLSFDGGGKFRREGKVLEHG